MKRLLIGKFVYVIQAYFMYSILGEFILPATNLLNKRILFAW